jgi:hypothetical protein
VRNLFKSVKVSLVKLETKGRKPLSKAEIEKRVNQMLERSFISEEVIDVFEAMGMKRPGVFVLNYMAIGKGLMSSYLRVRRFCIWQKHSGLI